MAEEYTEVVECIKLWTRQNPEGESANDSTSSIQSIKEEIFRIKN